MDFSTEQGNDELFQKLLVVGHELADENEELLKKVNELQSKVDHGEAKLQTITNHCEILERQTQTMETSLEINFNEKEKVKIRLADESKRCNHLENEINVLKKKMENLAELSSLETKKTLERQITELQSKLLQKEADYTRTESHLQELILRTSQLEEYRDRVQEMKHSLFETTQRLVHVETQRKRESLEIQERENLLTKQNSELEARLQEALQLLEKNEEEMQRIRGKQVAEHSHSKSMSNSLADLQQVPDSDIESLDGASDAGSAIGAVEDLLAMWGLPFDDDSDEADSFGTMCSVVSFGNMPEDDEEEEEDSYLNYKIQDHSFGAVDDSNVEDSLMKVSQKKMEQHTTEEKKNVNTNSVIRKPPLLSNRMHVMDDEFIATEIHYIAELTFEELLRHNKNTGGNEI